MYVRQLRYFLAVVDHGSVNKAAAALYVAQPSLSQAIRALERDHHLPEERPDEVAAAVKDFFQS